MRKRITWRYITLAGLMALGLTGCGASSKGAATEAAVADSAYLSDDMYSYDNSYYEEAASEEYDSTTGSTENVEKVQDTSRKLIKNVDMSVETEEFDKLLANVEKPLLFLVLFFVCQNIELIFVAKLQHLEHSVSFLKYFLNVLKLAIFQVLAKSLQHTL